MFDPKLKEALGRVQKPGRYTGGEPGSVYKDKEKVDVRFAFCFPDTYEVGMSCSMSFPIPTSWPCWIWRASRSIPGTATSAGR